MKLTWTLSQGYLISLGKARTAQVQKDARIGEAQFKRDAVIRVSFFIFLCCHFGFAKN